MTEYEFGGPIGALGTMLGLPFAIYALYYFCNLDYCFGPADGFQLRIPSVNPQSLWDTPTFAVVCGWMVFQALIERLVPCTVAQGVPLPGSGKRLGYKMNGHHAFWISLIGVVGGWASGVLPLSTIYDNYVAFATSAIVISLLLSVYLYIKSFAKGALLAKGGNTGNAIYDFFIGRELNPRWGTFDLKVFCELRPGLIGWVIINLGMAAKQYENLGYVTKSMMLINVFQGVYVWDALYHESAILTTMDVTTDGFGFMLAFGDLAWVPFSYTLQARYLVDFATPDLSTEFAVFVAVLNVVGFTIFRCANSQKDAFRANPDGPTVKHLKTITTKTGRKLLVSGWWGAARKINYTGDWLMGLAWCLCCGFRGHLIPYFYCTYFAILLIHRAFRDNHACSLKYGKDWNEYKKRVPYVFIPYVI
eukprot:TRINITY_DN67309_c11_g2_i1.p1 TRINITY_DN67309_c11_g2~~TRINITY_DN67309_c11_g2_i1.p1  ORF type:complete len:419 (-),score=5.85 TRINITY_DN67309_c11_g2_i1:438-1694(-)